VRVGYWLAGLGLLLATALPAQAPAVGAALPAGYERIEGVSLIGGGLAERVVLNAEARTVAELLSAIAQRARLSFAADPALPGMAIVRQLPARELPARDAILLVLRDTPLMALVSRSGQIVVVPRDAYPLQPSDAGVARRTLRVTGFVRNRDGRDVIRHAQLLTADGVRTESNDDGFFTLTVAPGSTRVQVRAIGFAPSEVTIDVTEHSARDLLLTPRDTRLPVITVSDSAARTDRADLATSPSELGVLRVPVRTVRALPSVLGEPDALRTLSLLPGVAQTNDASTMVSVRGGSADQNLYLLDEATVFNPSHVLGLLSSFNSDAVDNITLYSGAMPARLGGRVASVIDVRQREGNADRLLGSASIGLLASRAVIEGPLPTRRGSFMVTARRSYLDLLTQFARDSAVRAADLNFYDINARMNWRLGDRGSLSASAYRGRDAIGAPVQANANWGNTTGTLRWKQAVGSRLFSSVTAAIGTYDYRIEAAPAGVELSRWTSVIRNSDVKIDETFTLSSGNRIEFGIHFNDQRIEPASLAARGLLNTSTDIVLRARLAQMPAVYAGQSLSLLGDRLGVQWGLRFAGMIRRGPGTVYRYRDDAPTVFSPVRRRWERGDVIDSSIVAPGATIARFGGLEPRLALRWALGPTRTITASAGRTQQFLILATRTNTVTPLDVWEPAGPYLRPQVSDQVALGLAQTAGGLDLSVEAYLRRTNGTVDFIDGADVVLNPRLETLWLQGDGRAYGLELLARRTTGPLTGWLSYTLSRTEQRVPLPPGVTTSLGGGIESGRYYLNPFDRTHNLSVALTRAVQRRWTVGGVFLFASGAPATYPVSRYVVDGFVLAEFGPRNAERLPAYHRLDLNVTRHFRRSDLQIGVLNAYNRYNAQTLRFRSNPADPQQTQAVQTAVFGLVPSVQYTVRFR
jgi:hypothetical protein